ncbi:MAG: hypothetical protein K2M69_04775 [Muribaculaceae bacterium]|nr:hypothetical protein [Muribaculaceae bacterium]
MEEKSIREILDNFEPELSSDFQFMSRLKSNMDSVELVRKYNHEVMRNNRKAIVIAAAVGFLFGLLFSMFLPAIGEAMKGLQTAVQPGSFTCFVMEHYFPIILTIIAGASAFISLNTFELATFIMRKNE